MKSRPRSQRDMTLRSPREIATHLAFAAYLLALPLGTVALVAGTARSSATGISLGMAALVAFALLHLFARRALGFGTILLELKRNPFKTARQAEPSAPSTTPKAACGDSGVCGL